MALPYRLLDRFRELFDGVRYLHRDSSLGDSVASCLPEDLYALDRSTKLKSRIDSRMRVLNVRNHIQGIKARRGDGTFGEIIPGAKALAAPGFAVGRGPVATIEIGSEVKILAKAMIKQIDRVMTDLQNQRREFQIAKGHPITVGIVGINQAARCVSYEGDTAYETGVKGRPHPAQEAAKSESRLMARVAPEFDEFLILRFRATNESPYLFEWVNFDETVMNYGAVLTRISIEYDKRF